MKTCAGTVFSLEYQPRDWYHSTFGGSSHVSYLNLENPSHTCSQENAQEICSQTNLIEIILRLSHATPSWIKLKAAAN